MKKQDARVSMTTECLNNIKMIKLYSWVDIFKDMIDQRRKEELNVQWGRMNLLMLTIASLNFFPLML